MSARNFRYAPISGLIFGNGVPLARSYLPYPFSRDLHVVDIKLLIQMRTVVNSGSGSASFATSMLVPAIVLESRYDTINTTSPLAGCKDTGTTGEENVTLYLYGENVGPSC
jgi:hypothetical protein